MKKEYDAAITCGVFDMLHQGHIELFEMMRGMASEVRVIVHDDRSTWQNKKRFPVQENGHRKRNIRLTGMVLHVKDVFNKNPGDAIQKTIRDCRFKFGKDAKIVYVRGDDWQDFPGRENIEKEGVQIVFKKYTEGVSSTKRRSEL